DQPSTGNPAEFTHSAACRATVRGPRLAAIGGCSIFLRTTLFFCFQFFIFFPNFVGLNTTFSITFKTTIKNDENWCSKRD
ncbi:MAG: hypothetical protein IIZ89_06665, partial [Muribaculaceae bacterium]|nr:hypothetical protein [Muribaculaceae bacterium]